MGNLVATAYGGDVVRHPWPPPCPLCWPEPRFGHQKSKKLKRDLSEALSDPQGRIRLGRCSLDGAISMKRKQDIETLRAQAAEIRKKNSRSSRSRASEARGR